MFVNVFLNWYWWLFLSEQCKEITAFADKFNMGLVLRVSVAVAMRTVKVFKVDTNSYIVVTQLKLHIQNHIVYLHLCTGAIC